MRISFSTGTFYHRSLSYSLTLAREIGYDGVELVLGLGYSIGGVRWLQRSASAYDVPILSVHPPFRMLPGWPRHSEKSIPQLAAVTQALGVDTCVVHVAGFSRLSSPRAQRFSAGLREALALTGGKLRIGLESNQYIQRPQRYLLDDLHALVDFAGEHGCDVTFDTCHAGANGEDILACYDIVRPVLCNVHLNDVIWHDSVPHTHRLPGAGQLPLDRFLGLLARDGYTGLVTLEIRPTQIGLFGRARHAEQLRNALAYVRAAIAQPITQ